MKLLIYEDENGYVRIIQPANDFQHPTESDYSALARISSMALPDVCEFLAVSDQKIPKDKTFRSAWKKGDLNEPIKICLSSCIAIHRTRLQVAAKRKILLLQELVKEAIAKQNLPEIVALNATCRILETIHEMNLTHCKSVEDVKYAIPKELHDCWDFYDLSGR